MKTEAYPDTISRENGGPINVIVHPSPRASAIIINCPGYQGDINGYNNKYRTLGEWLSKKGVGAFIQMPNIVWPDKDYRTSLIDDVNAVCDYAVEHAADMCPLDGDIYLMGFSAGAGAIAAVADRPSVKKILLMAPSADAAQNQVKKSLTNFNGEVYIAIGDKDDVVGSNAGEHYFKLVKSASVKKLVTIHDCDHQFRGTENGKIMSKAPLWAFAGDKSFPSPEGGIVLY